MKNLEKLIFIFISTFILMTTAQASEKLRICTEGAYPPFNTVDKNGELQGFDIDITKVLCAKMNVSCNFVQQDWDGIIPALLQNKCDAIVASMSITEERKKALDFTEKYYTNKLRFIGRKDRKMDISEAALQGKRLGAQRATIAAFWLEKNRPNSNIKLYDTQENVYLDLAADRTDGVLADVLVSYDWLESKAGQKFEFKGEPVFDGDIIGIAVRKGEKNLVRRLNAAIKAAVADGSYADINAKYFPFSIY